jgi:hypothetical protein
VTFKWNFHPDQSPINDPVFQWTPTKIKGWKDRAKGIVESYFNGLKFKCVSPQPKFCPCPKGVKINLNVEWVEDGGDPVNVIIGWRQSHASPDGLTLMYGDIQYSDYDHDGKNYKRRAILHECGHYLGLQHPGQPGAKDEYTKDPGSLMGVGEEMRKADFDKAFCKRIVESSYEAAEDNESR